MLRSNVINADTHKEHTELVWCNVSSVNAQKLHLCTMKEVDDIHPFFLTFIHQKWNALKLYKIKIVLSQISSFKYLRMSRGHKLHSASLDVGMKRRDYLEH